MIQSNSVMHSRRNLIRSLVGGSLLMPGILSELLASEENSSPSADGALVEKSPHFKPRHTRLTYRHAGRDYRLTDVHGRLCAGF